MWDGLRCSNGARPKSDDEGFSRSHTIVTLPKTCSLKPFMHTRPLPCLVSSPWDLYKARQ